MSTTLAHRPSPPVRPAQPSAPVPATPASDPLLALVEKSLAEFPVAWSLAPREGAPPGVRVPNLAGQTFTLRAPPSISEQQVLDRFAVLTEPWFTPRERPVGEPVEEGDVLMVDLRAVPQGEREPFLHVRQQQVRLVEQPLFPGFLEALVGKPVGQKVEFSGPVPEQHPEARLRGTAARYEVTLHSAREWVPPQADDTKMLAELGHGSTLDQVMESIVQELNSSQEDALEAEARYVALEALQEQTQAIIPPEWVDQELREQWRQLRALSQEPDQEPLPEQAPRDWLQEQRMPAERRLRLNLALQAVCARDRVPPVEPRELDEFIQALAQGLDTPESTLRQLLARERATSTRVARVAWFLSAAEHVLQQVQFRVEEPPAEPGKP